MLTCFVCNNTIKGKDWQKVPDKGKILARHISKCYPNGREWHKMQERMRSPVADLA